MADKKSLAKKQEVEKSPAERFRITTERLMAESTGVERELSDHQKRLIQGYFLLVDMSLEEARSRGGGGGKNLPMTWENVDMPKLASAVVASAEVGLDPSIPNHVFAIPYYNGAKKKYTVDLRRGYVGTEFIARQHSLDPIVDIIFELVHENDEFKTLKKQGGVGVESYEFKVKDPFNRGKLVGGFGYVIYEDERKNKLVVMSLADMDKRRKIAKTDTFWKPWEEEMYYKTLVSHVCSSRNIPRNPASVAEYSRHLRMKELEFSRMEAQGVLQPVGYEASFKDVGGDEEVELLDFDDEPIEAQEAEVVETATEAEEEEDMPLPFNLGDSYDNLTFEE